MKFQKSIFGVFAALLLLLPAFVARPAVAKVPTLALCAKSIELDGLGAQSDIIKAFQACDKLYRADLAKGAAHYNSTAGTSSGFAKSAKGCETGLAKVLGLTSKTGQGKWKTKLDGLVPLTCSDTHLLLLGHLPKGTFGDLWSRYVVMTALNKAYNQEIELARDTVNMFQDIGADPSGLCPTCKLLVTAPCYEHACNYVTAGSSAFNNNSDALGPIPGSLVGSSAFTLCQFKDVNPANEYLVTGSTSKGIQPVNVGGLTYACPLTLAVEGYISCGGTDGKVNYSSCQDSKAASATDDPGGCTAAINPDVCASASADPVNGGFNGGACVKYTKAGSQAGGAFILNTTQLNIVINTPSQLGPDNLPCTNDDVATIAAPGSISLTTGQADTQVLNTVSETITNGPDTGVAFNCGTNGSIIQSSNLSGAKIAGAFSTLSQPLTNDSAITFHIGCQ